MEKIKKQKKNKEKEGDYNEEVDVVGEEEIVASLGSGNLKITIIITYLLESSVKTLITGKILFYNYLKLF